MKWIGSEKVGRPVVGREWVKLLYYGKDLIWQAISKVLVSCFGLGYWINDKPWLNQDSWKNNDE